MTNPGTRLLSSTVALLLALLGATAMVRYHQKFFIPRALAIRHAQGLGNGYSFGNDFYQVWLTSRELFHHNRNPYSPEMTRQIQIGLNGRPLDANLPGDPIDQRAFPYPAFTILLFWPAAEIPFEISRVIVVCGLAVLTATGVMLWLRVLAWRPDWKWIAVIVLLTMSSYPALEGFYAGQVGLLVAFLLAASMVALQRGRYLAAGFLVALATVKPQVTALVIFYLLLWTVNGWRTRKNFLWGFLATLMLLIGASLAAMPHWIPYWIRTVLAYRHYTTPPLVTEVLTSSLGPHWSNPATMLLTAAALISAVVLAWRCRAAEFASSSFWFAYCVLLSITTITLLPGQAVYDHLVLLAAILVLARNRNKLLDARQVPRLLLIVGAVVLLWPWFAALVLLGLRPISPALGTAQLSLPLRTAASLPFVILALLFWMRRLTLSASPEAA